MKLFKKGTGLFFKIILCMIALALFLAGVIVTRVRSSASYKVRQELARIHAIDEDTLRSYISADADLDAAADVIPLFFSSMRYRITSSQTNGNEAAVNVRITNLDTRQLSHDICHELSSLAIRSMLLPESEKDESFANPYGLLLDMIRDHNYPQKDTEAVFHLTRTNRLWEIRHDAQLSDELVSHLSSNLRDPYILSAREVLQLYLDTFGEMTPADWKTYLNIEDVFSTGSTSLYQEIDDTYLDLVCESYDYEIISAEESGNNATARVNITGPDLKNVIRSYRDKLAEYAKTVDSITSDSVTLSDTAASFLLEALKSEASVTTHSIDLTLTNNGRTWQLGIDDDFTDALLGNLADALEVFKETEADNAK